MDELNFNLAQREVLDTLQKVVCQKPEFLKSSEEKLSEWVKVPGYNTILLNICSNYGIDHNVRLLALLCFKNGVDRYWRKTAPFAISEEEKASIRAGLQTNFLEPQPNLAKMRAVVIAKIARYDVPHDWSDLIPTLLSAVKSDDAIIQNRSVLILREVIKNLSTKFLAVDKRSFRTMSCLIFGSVSSVWNMQTTIFLENMKSKENYEIARNYLENALITLKTLNKLTIYGFRERNDDVTAFLNEIFVKIEVSSGIRHGMLKGQDESSLDPLENQLIDLLERFICKLMGILLGLLQQHPYLFVDYIVPSLRLAVYYAFTSAGQSYLFEKFLIQSFNMIKAIVLCREYNSSKCDLVSDNTPNAPNIIKAYEIKLAFFGTSVVSEICSKLITHYFLLTSSDLELWDNDPESFAMDDPGESWKYSLRPCVETLFVTIFHEFRVLLAPLLVELISSNAAIVSPEDFQAILLKDAVYNAIGLAAFDMYDEVNFNEWFLTTLSQEISIPGNSYRIIRRRVAWLLGRWTGVKLSADLFPALYDSMISLLSPQEDLVVRLQAAQTIKTAVDDFEFNQETFIKYLHPLFEALFQLLKDVQECDTKMRVLSVLYLILDRVGPSVEPYSDNLFKYLPLLWMESEKHNMLRCSIVSTLALLVKALGHIKVPVETHDFILSIISFSTDMNHDTGFYLLEDGLELWFVILENSAQITPDILQLFNNMALLLENNTEFLQSCINIMGAYVLLAPEIFLKTHGETMVRICSELLDDLKKEGVIAILRLFEVCIKAHPHIAIPLLKSVIINILKFLQECQFLECVTSFTTPHFSIVARVLLYSREAFYEIVDKVSVDLSKSQDEVISFLVERWILHIGSLAHVDRKKLLALALCLLLTSNLNFVYDKFCGILLTIVNVLSDVAIPKDPSGEIVDSLMYDVSEDACVSDGENLETEHRLRRIKLSGSDPVHSVSLEKLFKFQLNELEMMVGAEKFTEFVNTVDVETLDMVCFYVNIREVSIKESEASNNELIKLFSSQLGI